MRYRKILVPFDGSKHAQDAFLAALDLAQGNEGVSITVFYASSEEASYESTARMVGLEHVDAMALHGDEFREDMKAALLTDEVKQTVDAAGIDLTFKAVAERPQEAIPNLAKGGGYDLIVMGSRGLGAVTGLIGSVSKAVLHKVEIPVLIVR